MDYEGLQITTSADVYEPAEDSMLAADVIGSVLEDMSPGAEVLDLGCGTGVLGLRAALENNVQKVVFADSDQNALALAKKNADLNSGLLHAECEFVRSDLFSRINCSFDIIIFNAPYLNEGKGEELSNAWYGGKGGVEISRDFMQQYTMKRETYLRQSQE